LLALAIRFLSTALWRCKPKRKFQTSREISISDNSHRSGLLNAKHRELMDLQQLAQQRIARSKARLAEAYSDSREVKRDLEWSQKRVS
jgi:hypothetical protein